MPLVVRRPRLALGRPQQRRVEQLAAALGHRRDEQWRVDAARQLLQHGRGRRVRGGVGVDAPLGPEQHVHALPEERGGCRQLRVQHGSARLLVEVARGPVALHGADAQRARVSGGELRHDQQHDQQHGRGDRPGHAPEGAPAHDLDGQRAQEHDEERQPRHAGPRGDLGERTVHLRDPDAPPREPAVGPRPDDLLAQRPQPRHQRGQQHQASHTSGGDAWHPPVRQGDRHREHGRQQRLEHRQRRPRDGSEVARGEEQVHREEGQTEQQADQHRRPEAPPHQHHEGENRRRERHRPPRQGGIRGHHQQSRHDRQGSREGEPHQRTPRRHHGRAVRGGGHSAAHADVYATMPRRTESRAVRAVLASLGSATSEI